MSNVANDNGDDDDNDNDYSDDDGSNIDDERFCNSSIEKRMRFSHVDRKRWH